MLSHVRLLAIPWIVARQAPLSMEFSRQEYWNRLPLHTPGDLPEPGIKPTALVSPALAGDSLSPCHVEVRCIDVSLYMFNACFWRSHTPTVRTRHRPTDWFKIGKGVLQSCIRSPCLFNVYAEYIMGNASLDTAQAGTKIALRNKNNI